MIVFSGKTHGFVGETHHFRKPPIYVANKKPGFEKLSAQVLFSHVPKMLLSESQKVATFGFSGLAIEDKAWIRRDGGKILRKKHGRVGKKRCCGASVYPILGGPSHDL